MPRPHWFSCPRGLKRSLLHAALLLALWSELAEVAEATSGDELASAPPSCTQAGEAQEVCNLSVSSQRTAASALQLDALADVLAISSGLVSAAEAAQLRAIVDRRWSALSERYLEEVLENDTDDDDLIDKVDGEPSYSADIVNFGSCTDPAGEGDETQVTEQADCELTEHLLADLLTPIVNRMVQKWSIPPTLYPCHSFVKRYLARERVKMDPHRDFSSFVTANVLLNDPAESNGGGLEVYPHAEEHMPDVPDMMTDLEFRRHLKEGVLVQLEGLGSLAVHRGTLWHDAHIPRDNRSRRYTWITWYAATEQECIDERLDEESEEDEEKVEEAEEDEEDEDGDEEDDEELEHDEVA